MPFEIEDAAARALDPLAEKTAPDLTTAPRRLKGPKVRLCEIVFTGDRLQRRVLQEVVEQHYGRRISGKPATGKCVDLKKWERA